MDNVSGLLFKLPIDGRPLFKNQQDLVNHLMQDSQSEYYVKPDEHERYNQVQNRLKAYVSQLLSPNVTRNITPDFEASLTRILTSRFERIVDAEKMAAQIIEELKSKKVTTAKTDSRNFILEQLTNDFQNGRYISIITSRPLEVEAENVSDKYSLRKLVFDDFIESLSNIDKPIKDYRFNFPVDSSGNLFWKGIYKLLYRHIKSLDNKKMFFENVQRKIPFQLELNTDLFNEPVLSDLQVLQISNTILRALRKECKVAVFTCEAPIFTLPLIIIDPAETKNAKVYAIIDTNNDNFNVYKFSNEEVILWRLFVWDKLKSQTYCGRMIEIDNNQNSV